MRWAGRTSRGAGALGAPGDGIDLVYRRGWRRAVRLSSFQFGAMRRRRTHRIGGAGVVLYIFLLCTMPEEGASSPTLPLRRVLTRPNTGHNAPTTTPPEQSSKRSPRRNNLPVAEILCGASLLAAGVSLLLVQLGVQLDLKVMLPGLAVFVWVGLTWWLIVDRHRPGRHLLPRIL